MELSEELIERATSVYPTPVADAVNAVASAANLHERRDRVVECFRTTHRSLAGLALAARLYRGEGPGGEAESVAGWIHTLRQHGLTDGQWIGLTRELLRGWAQVPEQHPVPELVALFHGARHVSSEIDGLLKMRKSETAAHASTGDEGELTAILERRIPQLQRLLERAEAVWLERRLVVALSPGEGEQQTAWSLRGATPVSGRWRRFSLSELEGPLAPGRVVLLSADRRPCLLLEPVLQLRRATPEAVEEVFFLDGSKGKHARFMALPSTAGYEDPDTWSELASKLPGGDSTAETESVGGMTRPYRGLQSFGPEHAVLFFGREAQAQRLGNRIRKHPWVTVFGASGSGKTSLLAAGVFPGMTDVRLAVLRPGASPMKALGRALRDALGLWPGASVLDEVLSERPEELGGVLERWRAAVVAEPGLVGVGDGAAREAADFPPRLVLWVDQGEELFTLCHDRGQRARFAGALASAGREADGPSRVVLSTREDFLGRFAELEAWRSHYHRQSEPVLTPQEPDLVRILATPAARFGVRFEDGLVETMVAEVAGQAGALPVLQFCADKLWERRDKDFGRMTVAAYQALGGVQGALAGYADRVYDGLEPAEQLVARRLLVQLVSEEHTRATLPRELALSAAGERDTAEAVVGQLVAAHLLTSRAQEDGAATLELVHEALIERWGRLREWLGDDQDLARARVRVIEAQRRWSASKQPTDLLLSEGTQLEEGRRVLGEPSAGGVPLDPEVSDYIRRSEARVAAEQRRRRVALASLAGLALVAMVTGALAYRAAGEVERAVQRGLDRLAAATAQRFAASDPSLSARLLLASDTWGTADVNMARELAQQPLSVTLRGHEDGILSAAYSPDGTRVVTTSLDTTARVWNADGTGEPVVLSGHTGPVTFAAFSPDGARIVTASSDNTARVWNTDGGGEPIVLQGHTSGVRSATFSPDGARVLTASHDNTARVWKADGGGDPIVLRGHTSNVKSATFSPDGVRVLTASIDGSARVWKADGTGDPVILGGEIMLRSASFSPDGTRVVIASLTGTATVWNADGRGEPVVLRGHTGSVRFAAFSPESTRVVTVGHDKTARIWRADGSGEPIVLSGHTDQVEYAAFSPDGDRVLTASLDHTARVWAADGHSEPIVLRGHTRLISSAVFSPDGRRVLTVSHDDTARVWNPEGSGEPVIKRGPMGRVRAGSFSRPHVVTVSRNRTVTIHDTRVVRSGEGSDDSIVLIMHPGHTERIMSARFSGDGRRVVTASRDETARVWNADGSGEPIVLRGHTEAVNSAAFSPDGSRIVTASNDETARVWNADGTGEPIVLRGHTRAVYSAVFSWDGSRIVTASNDETARVWNADGTDEPIVFSGHTRSVGFAVFSRDGRRVVTVSGDKTARVWNADGSGEPTVLSGHAGAVHLAAFSRDGKRVVTASQDKTARVWNADGQGDPIVLSGHNHSIGFAGFDRTCVFTADGTARFWTLDAAKVRQVLRDTVGCLAADERGRYLAESAKQAVTAARACQEARAKSLQRQTNVDVCQ